jgi:hypothetical protein
VTKDRGNRLQNALAGYLRQWWPHAESAGAGRNGTDVLGTPGVTWEVKTASDFKRDFRPMAWVRQSLGHGSDADIPVVVYYPPGLGEKNTGSTLAILPLHVLMQLLAGGGYAPGPGDIR